MCLHLGHYFSFIWAQMWPNVFAPGFWTILGISLSHYKLHKHVNRKHDELAEHVSQKHNELHKRMFGDGDQ